MHEVPRVCDKHDPRLPVVLRNLPLLFVSLNNIYISKKTTSHSCFLLKVWENFKSKSVTYLCKNKQKLVLARTFHVKMLKGGTVESNHIYSVHVWSPSFIELLPVCVFVRLCCKNRFSSPWPCSLHHLSVSPHFPKNTEYF